MAQKKELELGFDITSERVGWNLTTFITDLEIGNGTFVRVENVPLSVYDAIVLQPHLRDWIISETQKNLETFGEFYPADVDRLRAELAAVR